MADNRLNKTGLRYLLTKLNGFFAKQADLTALDTKVDGIIAEGGEPNVIETIKKNGTAITPDANKAVDIPIPTVAKSGSGETEKVTVTDGENVYEVPSFDAMEDYVSEHGGVIQKVKYDGTELTIDPIDKSVNVPKETFVAEYDSTTKAALSEALSAEKLIIINYSGEFYTTVYSAETASYTGLYAIAGNASLYFTVNSSNVWTRTETVLATDSDIPTKVSDLTNDSGYQTASDVQTSISEQIGKVYKPKGSILFADLPALTAAELGNVYNVTDAFTTTADFKEGAGISVPAGSNVGIINDGTDQNPVYKYDLFSGFVDLTDYWNTTNLTALTTVEIDEVWDSVFNPATP